MLLAFLKLIFFMLISNICNYNTFFMQALIQRDIGRGNISYITQCIGISVRSSNAGFGVPRIECPRETVKISYDAFWPFWLSWYRDIGLWTHRGWVAQWRYSIHYSFCNNRGKIEFFCLECGHQLVVYKTGLVWRGLEQGRTKGGIGGDIPPVSGRESEKFP